jgi:hypothetical protein
MLPLGGANDENSLAAMRSNSLAGIPWKPLPIRSQRKKCYGTDHGCADSHIFYTLPSDRNFSGGNQKVVFVLDF